MELELESMKKLKSTVERCIDELAKKQDITPAETKAALDGMELREMLKCEIEDCKEKEKEDEEGYSERGYSRYGERPYRQYRLTSFGRPMMSRSNGSYRSRRRSYGDREMVDYSGDYGVQGWYRSGDGSNNSFNDSYRSYYGPDFSERSNRGYSRHSLGDRVVEKLEHMMDTTESDYEREELHKFIRMIRSAAD